MSTTATKRIPVLDLGPEIEANWDQLNEAFQRVLRSGQFIGGPEVTAFEQEAAAYLGAKHAVGVNSGTDALVIALRAIGVGADDVRAILTKTPPEVQELEHALECPAGVPPSARGLQRPVDKDLLEMHVQYEQLVEAVVSVLDERDRLAFQLNAAKQELHQRDFVRSE